MSLNDFYRGEDLAIKSQDRKLFLTVPVDKIEGETAFKISHLFINQILPLFNYLSRILFIPLAILSLLVASVHPTSLNIGILLIYAAILIWKFINLFHFPTFEGMVRDESGNPLENKVLKLVDETGAEVVEVTKTNKEGEFKFFSPKNSYYLETIGSRIGEINTRETNQKDIVLQPLL